MKNAVFYVITVMVWGSTWLAIKYQLGEVNPMVSVVYRFGLAAVMLLLYCMAKGLRLRFSLKEHLMMVLLGVLLFSLNYWLIYKAEIYITSGLTAVVFSSIVFMNIANGSLLLGMPMERKTLIGAVIGILGIAVIFMPEIRQFSFSDNGIVGICFGFGSVVLASLGNIASALNSRNKIPILQANGFGMLYGSVFLAVVALVLGEDFTLSFSMPYIGSLVYLAVFGSIVGFGCYLTLVGSIGPDKAAYAIMLVPAVALLFSSVFEGYQWTLGSVGGLALVLAGNFMVLRKPVPVA